MAKVTKTAVRNELRAKYFEKIQNFMKESEDVLQVATNKFVFPTVDGQSEDQWIMVTVSVPLGAERGAEPYDGYGEAEAFQMKQAEKAEKKRNADEKKAKQIAEREKKKAEKEVKKTVEFAKEKPKEESKQEEKPKKEEKQSEALTEQDIDNLLNDLQI